MANKKKHIAPPYTALMQPTWNALKQMGGTGTNDAIRDAVIKNMQLSEAAINEPHGKSGSTELEYQLYWARTYLKKYGALVNNKPGEWTIATVFPILTP